MVLHIDPLAAVVFLATGLAAGWLAGILTKGGGFGLPANLVIGVIGAFLSGYLLPQIGIYISGGIIGSILSATIGALIFLAVLGVISRIL